MKLIKVIYYGFLALFILVFSLSYIVELFFMPTDKEIEKLVYQDTGFKLTYHEYEWQDQTMGYVATGNDTSQRVIMVHGSPGAWGNYSKLLSNPDLAKNFYLIALDRVGYGMSTGTHGIADLDLQAASIKPLCSTSKGGIKPILIGHSMGGPIVIQSAIDYGESLTGVISVAGSFDPDLEFNEFYRGFFKIFPFNLLFTRDFKASNDELFTHQLQLSKLSGKWGKVGCKVHIIQGGKDNLVDPGNFEFAKAHLMHKRAGFTYIPNEDHFIPFTHPQPILDAIWAVRNNP